MKSSRFPSAKPLRTSRSASTKSVTNKGGNAKDVDVKLGGPQRVTIHTGPEVASVDVELLATAMQPAGRLTLKAERIAHGRCIHRGEVPEDAIAHRRLVSYHLIDHAGMDLQVQPTDGPVLAQPGELVSRNGQFFLYDPGDYIAPPRMSEFHFSPRKFAARRIRVLLPRCYDLNIHKRYPVLYAEDGQNVFHPGSHFGSWDLDVTVSRLIRRAEVPEIIVVAIDNSADRHVEYVPEYGEINDRPGRGGEYLQMLAEELIPRINHEYRTIPEARYTGHIGSSLGGLLGFHAANTMKGAFGAVAAMSPSFWVNLEENLWRASQPPKTRSRLWIDSGCEKVSDGYERTVKIRNRLLQAGHKMGTEFMHVVGVGHEHKEADWARRAPDVLKWMFPVEHFHPTISKKAY